MKSYPLTIEGKVVNRPIEKVDLSDSYSAGPTEKGPLFVPQGLADKESIKAVYGADSFDATKSAMLAADSSGSGAAIIRAESQEDFVSDAVELSVNGKARAWILVNKPLDDAEIEGNADLFTLSLGSDKFTLSFDPKRPNVYVKDLDGQMLHTWAYKADNSPQDLSESPVSASVIKDAVSIAKEKISRPETPWIVSQEIQGIGRTNLFKFELGYESVKANKEFKITVENIDENAFDVLLRRPGQRTEFVEAFRRLTLDSTDPRFIGRVIGNKRKKYDGDGQIKHLGSYEGQSEYISVVIGPLEEFSSKMSPRGFSELRKPPEFAQHAVIKENYNKFSDSHIYSGHGLGPEQDYSQYEKGEFLGFSFDSVNNENYLTSATEPGKESFSFSFDPLKEPNWKRKFQVPFQRGWPGHGPFEKKIGFSGVSELVHVLKSSDPSFNINSLYVSGVSLDDRSKSSKLLSDFASENKLDFIWVAPLTLIKDKKFSKGELHEISQLYNSTNIAAYHGFINNSEPLAKYVLSVYSRNDNDKKVSSSPSGVPNGLIDGALEINKLSLEVLEGLKQKNINTAVQIADGICLLGDNTFNSRPGPFSSLRIKRSVIWLSSELRKTFLEELFNPDAGRLKARITDKTLGLMQSEEIRRSVDSYSIDQINVEGHDIDVRMQIKFYNTIEALELSFTILDDQIVYG